MKSYWDKHPIKFRAFFVGLAALFLFISSYNIFRSARTVFSGTTYLSLPSPYYITQDAIVRKIDHGNQIAETVDTLKAGSFIISLMSRSDTTAKRLDSLIEALQPYQYVYIRAFNIEHFISNSNQDDEKMKFVIDSFQVKREDIPENWVKYLDRGVFIGYIESGGATDRAGIKPGDVLLTLNDSVLHINVKPHSQSLTTESLRFLRSHQAGQVIPYKILRGTSIRVFNVELATFGVSIETLLVILASIIFFGTAFFFGLLRPRFFAARITAIALLVGGLHLASSVIINPSQMDIVSYWIPVVNNLSLIILLALIAHSLVYFPSENARLSSRKTAIRLPYWLSGVTAAAFLLIYFIDVSLFESLIVMIPLMLVFLANIIYILITRVLLIGKLPPDYKKQTLITRYAIILAFIGLVVQVVAAIFNLNNLTWIKYIYFAVILIPAAFFYSTWKFRLLDLDFKIRRNIQYSFFNAIVYLASGLIFILVLFGLSHLSIDFPNLKYTGTTIEVLNHPLDPWLNSFYGKMFSMTIILLFSYIMVKSLRFIFYKLDRKFYRSTFDFRYIQTELIKLFETTKELFPLAKLIVEKLSELVHLKRTGIIFFQAESGRKHSVIYIYDNLRRKHIDFSFEDDIEHTISSFKGAFSIEYLPLKCREFLSDNHFHKVIPIRHNDRLIAALFIGGKLSETVLNEKDLEFLMTLARNCASAVENAFLYEELAEQERIKQELAIARRIQLSSLPQKVPEIIGLEISASSLPAHEVGGDFYDFLNGKTDDLTVILGDVSGKGTSAALYMSRIQGIMQTLHSFCETPAELLAKANKQLYRHIESNSYITALAARIQTAGRKISIVRAGHLPLFHYSSSTGKVLKITPKGLGLGLSNEELFNKSLQETDVYYEKDDVFLLFSDGLTEVMDENGRFFGESGIESSLLELSALPAQTIKERLLNKIIEYSGSETLTDDMTVIVIKAV